MTQMPNTPPEPTGHTTAERPGELLERFLARIIDGLLLGVVYGILITIVRPGDAFGANLVMGIGFAALGLGYYAFLDSSRGATLGKMLLKLEVRGPSGGHPSVEESLRRNVLYVVGIFTSLPWVGLIAALGQFIGAIMIAVGIQGDKERRQAWHDRFAGGTYVVKRA